LYTAWFNCTSKEERYFRVPVTQLKEPKGNGDMQARLKCTTYPWSQYMVMWAVDRFKRYGRKSGRGNLFLDQSIGNDENNTFQLKFLF